MEWNYNLFNTNDLWGILLVCNLGKIHKWIPNNHAHVRMVIYQISALIIWIKVLSAKSYLHSLIYSIVDFYNNTEWNQGILFTRLYETHFLNISFLFSSPSLYLSLTMKLSMRHNTDNSGIKVRVSGSTGNVSGNDDK